MTRKVVYVQNGTPDASRPTVRISKTNEGVTFSVTSTGRSLTKARERAEAEFRALAEFCREMEKIPRVVYSVLRQDAEEEMEK